MAEFDYDVINDEEVKEVQAHIEKNGVSGIEKFIKKKLEGWKDVTINIGVTGDSGVGKSSFINAIRGLADDDDVAAKTGVTECTKDVAVYPHPTNDKIKFWDLPGIGTPNYPDLETYVEKVKLETYDTFLIFTANRFTENDLNLARKVKFINKSFFFIRTKIDDASRNEKRKKAFNEEKMLQNIMDDCLKNLEGLQVCNDVVFLISNHHPTRWDFARLTQSILDVLPLRQKECLTLSLDVLTSLSKDMLKRKVEILQGRILWVAAASAAGGAVPLPGLSVVVDLALITSEVSLYKTQLGLPDENTFEFRQMTDENQKKIRQFCVNTATHLATFMATYAASSAVEECTRFIPFVGFPIAANISYASTYYFLESCLNELEKTASSFLDERATKAVDDLDID